MEPMVNIIKKIISYLDNFSFFKKQNDDFFSVLLGITNICILSKEDIEEILFILPYVHVMGGIELFIKQYNNDFKLLHKRIDELESKFNRKIENINEVIDLLLDQPEPKIKKEKPARICLWQIHGGY